ncbi:DoxX-like family protein [Ignatzschineria sp. LJL83]
MNIVNNDRARSMMNICRITLGITFIGSGLIPLFLSDPVMRLTLLHSFPFPVAWHEMLFYGLVAMDVICGIWVLIKPSKTIIQLLMIVIAGYTILMTLFSPEVWQDPFSSMLKNLPILVLCYFFLILQKEVQDVR